MTRRMIFVCSLIVASSALYPSTLVAAESTSGASEGITYTLVNADAWPPEIKERIEKSMEDAVELYNKHGRFKKRIRVQYNPKVKTADGNSNGTIRFGKSISSRTAMHEISHTLGIGTRQKYRQMMAGGKWSGKRANNLLREINDNDEAVLRGDKAHFWPYGLNHRKEDGKKAREYHVKMVEAILLDMGAGTVVKD